MNNLIINEFKKLLEQVKFQFSTEINKKEKIAHSFRIRSIKNVINIVKKYNKVIKKGDDLKNIKGIGKHTIKRINEILKTGKLHDVTSKLTEKIYLNQVNELMKIIGIGESKANELIQKYNIKSIKQLQKVYIKKKILLSHQIQMGLKYYNVYKQHIPRKEVTMIDKYLHDKLYEIDPELFGIICGSYRRLKQTSNDVDLLIVHPNVKTIKQMKNKNNYLHKLIKILKNDKFLIDDMTDKKPINKYMGFSQLVTNNKKYPVRRIDIRYLPYNSYYPALLYFTGSGEFNRKMRMVAEQLGYKLNEYGLYKINKKKKTMKNIKVNSEKNIFDKLEMEYISPENR